MLYLHREVHGSGLPSALPQVQTPQVQGGLLCGGLVGRHCVFAVLHAGGFKQDKLWCVFGSKSICYVSDVVMQPGRSQSSETARARGDGEGEGEGQQHEEESLLYHLHDHGVIYGKFLTLVHSCHFFLARIVVRCPRHMWEYINVHLCGCWVCSSNAVPLPKDRQTVLC